jgi:phospholipid transport system substrate-binding protein
MKAWKKSLFAQFLGWALMMLMAPMANATVVDQSDPEKLVSTLSKVVIDNLNEQRESLKGHPQRIKNFANTYVLPYVDTAKMARYVMGTYWRQASPAQQEAFVKEFTETLLRSYANSMLNLNIKQFEVKGAQPEGRGRVIVSSVVTQSDGNVTKVQYRAYLDKKSNKWKLYDVVIEGVSMLLNYRKTYASAFQQKGIDGVIAEMRAKNQDFEKGAA